MGRPAVAGNANEVFGGTAADSDSGRFALSEAGFLSHAPSLSIRLFVSSEVLLMLSYTSSKVELREVLCMREDGGLGVPMLSIDEMLLSTE